MCGSNRRLTIPPREVAVISRLIFFPPPGISHVRRSHPGNFHTFPLTALDPGNFHQRLIRDFTDNSAPTYQ